MASIFDMFSKSNTNTNNPTTNIGNIGTQINNQSENILKQSPTVPININQNNIPKPNTPEIQNTQKINEKPSQEKVENKETKREDIDLMTHLTQRSNRVFFAAQKKATDLKNQFLDTEHVLYGLLTDPEIYKYFVDVKIQPQIIQQELEKLYKKENFTGQIELSPRTKRILDKSLVIARKLGFEFISPEHILLSLFEEGEGIAANVLTKLGVKKEDLNKKVVGKKEGLNETEEKKKSALELYTNDLTLKASQGLLDPVVERADVIERVIHNLSRRIKNNPVLVGEAGVGKTAIVEGLAQKIIKKEVPEPLLDKKILQLDLMSVLAGTSHRGEFEERMKELIEEIKEQKGRIILFIDEIHNLVGAGSGGDGSLDASNFLKPSLARSEIQIIGATTLTEYRKYIEKDPALERRLQPVLVPEPTEEQTIKMLTAIRDKFESFHRVKIPDNAIEAAVKLSKRYVGDRFLPDKAVDLMDEAAAAVRLPLISLPEEIRSLEERISQLDQEYKEAEKNLNKVKLNILQPKIEKLKIELQEKQEEFKIKKGQTTSSVSESNIKDIVSRWTGIPVSKISQTETEKLSKLEDIMHERLINQEVAVSSVAQAVRRSRAGLKQNQKPIGSFVFLGPTGVGKTELAKTLAEILFGQEEAIIRLDMTEYMEKHEVAKLLGAPPGYVGYEEGGKLTEAVRSKPYSIVLFDEIEKAHPDIFNILLQVLDDGRLTDNKGRTISFKNTVVICTSNIGSSMIQDEIIKTGKVEIEEPTILSTFTFSPRGRQIMSIVNKIFEKNPETNNNSGSWTNQMLFDYFAGQKLELSDNNFPTSGFDTHAISSKGMEIITLKDQVYLKSSTTLKIWGNTTLIEYFKDSVVINAIPDSPEEQLPTVKLKTHAFSPDEFEIITFKDRFWKRKENHTDWETGFLRDYFENSENMPINYWDIHTFSPNGDEYIIVGEKIWIKNYSDKKWISKPLKDFFGKDFPLEKEIEEKQKLEKELDKNQYQNIKNKVLLELRKFFKPELINRFDEVIIFEPLKYQHMTKIVELQLKALKNLMEEQSMGFSWTTASVKEIVRVGFDPIYGARPLKRTIQNLIENPISTLIIEKKLEENNQLNLDFEGENFVFNIEKIEFENKKVQNKIIKSFLCEKCKNEFKTEIVKNSETICPKCANKNLKEIVNGNK